MRAPSAESCPRVVWRPVRLPFDPDPARHPRVVTAWSSVPGVRRWWFVPMGLDQATSVTGTAVRHPAFGSGAGVLFFGSRTVEPTAPTGRRTPIRRSVGTAGVIDARGGGFHHRGAASVSSNRCPVRRIASARGADPGGARRRSGPHRRRASTASDGMLGARLACARQHHGWTRHGWAACLNSRTGRSTTGRRAPG